MKVILGWLTDPYLHVMILGIVLVTCVTAPQPGGSGLDASSPAASRAGDDVMMENMSPPLVTRAERGMRGDRPFDPACSFSNE